MIGRLSAFAVTTLLFLLPGFDGGTVGVVANLARMDRR
jgi:hypothetical protein